MPRCFPLRRLAAACVLSLAVSAVSAEPAAGWHSALFGPDWTPPSAVAFETDAFLQDFSYAGYRAGAAPLPELAEARVFDAAKDFGADPEGRTDSTAAIQAAIDAAGEAGGGIVFLAAGVYHVAPPPEKGFALRIAASGVVLRGEGTDKTRVLNTSHLMRGKSILLIEGPTSASWTTEEDLATTLAADLPGPAMALPVADVSGFRVGDDIVVRMDPTAEWILEHREPEWVESAGRLGSILYQRRIVSVDTDNRLLGIDAPARYYLKVRDGVRVYRKTGLLRDVGVERLSLGNVQHPGLDGWGPLDFSAPSGDYAERLKAAYGEASVPPGAKSAQDVHFSYAVILRRVVDGWIRDVSSFQAPGNTTGAHLLSNGVRLLQCRGVTLERVDLRRAQYGGGGGNGYLFRIDDSNECLLVDCRAEFARHGYSISGMACSGNVLLRCLDRDTGLQTGAKGRETTWGKGSDHHMYLSHSNLLDGCVASDSWFEARYRYYEKMSLPRHNLTSTHTVFWNTRGEGGERPYVVWSEQARMGYVIGTQGPVSAVRTDGAPEDRRDRVDPVDHVEGVGLGESLRPVSLFVEQRLRRLGRVE